MTLNSHPFPTLAPGASLWDRLPIESAKAWLGFTMYRDQGPHRTLLRTTHLYQDWCHQQKPSVRRNLDGPRATQPNHLIHKWSSRFHWVTRAAAYDEHVAIEETAARERARQKALARWESRLADQWETKWSIGEALLFKAAEILGKPLDQVTEFRTVYDETGRPILNPDGTPLSVPVIVEPIGYRLSDAAALAKAAILLHHSVGLEVKTALNPDPPEASPAGPNLPVSVSARDAALAELQAWREAHRQALGETAPPESGPAPEVWPTFDRSGILLALGGPPPDDDESPE